MHGKAKNWLFIVVLFHKTNNHIRFMGFRMVFNSNTLDISATRNPTLNQRRTP